MNEFLNVANFPPVVGLQLQETPEQIMDGGLQGGWRTAS
jgi:hypothetical protein